MLACSLSTTRMFAVLGASVMDGEQKKCYGGAGMIRYCIQKQDGSSQLVLQGLRRVRFEKCEKSEVFPFGEIEPIHPEVIADEEVEAARKSLMDGIESIKSKGVEIKSDVLEFLKNIHELDALVDILAGSMIQDGDTKKMLLIETCPLTRAKIAKAAIDKIPPDEVLPA